MSVNRIPYGYVEYSDEQFPKILEVNEAMLNYLNTTKEDSVWNNFYKENIYFMFPPGERDLVREQLKACKSSSNVLCFSHHLINTKNERLSCTALLKYNQSESISPCFSMIEIGPLQNGDSTLLSVAPYYPALTAVYDLIFKINFASSTVECMHQKRTSDKRSPLGVTMTIDSARAFWLDNYIVEADRQKMCEYMDRIEQFPIKADPTALSIEPMFFHASVNEDQSECFLITVIYDNAADPLVCIKNMEEPLNKSRPLPSDLTNANQIQTNPHPNEISDPSNTIPQTGIFARAFGHFDLFVNGKPLHFGEKSKELLALLIDRNGGIITSSEAISLLWPDQAVDDNLKARYRRTAMNMKNILEENGALDILDSSNGSRSIHTAALTCDYYEMLNGNEFYKSTFHNAYMTQYSWGEETLGNLWNYLPGNDD